MKIASSHNRVSSHTSREANDRIRIETKNSLHRYSHLSPARLNARLRELDAEWDIERLLQTNAASLSLLGIALASTVNKKWMYLSGAVALFLLQHSIQGWCPPLPVLRRLGFRTQQEIEEERYALKALRGDFEELEANPEDVFRRVTTH